MIENENFIEEGEIAESGGNAKRRKFDTVEMVGTVEEKAGYLQELRIILDQTDTPKEVQYKTPMSEAYRHVMVKAKMSVISDLKKRPVKCTVRRQTNNDDEESEEQISIVPWALMQRDVYNVMTQGFSQRHQHHLNGIMQGGASELIAKLQSPGAGFQEQIQKAELEFKRFIKKTDLTSLQAWK